MLANSQFYINAVSMRLVTDKAMSMFVVTILHSIDRVRSCNLSLEAHYSSEEASSRKSIAQNCKPFSFFYRERDSSSSPESEHAVVHIDKLAFLKVGSDILSVNEKRRKHTNVL